MSISLPCTCGKVLKAKEEMAGKRAKCPACGAVLRVPGAPEEDKPGYAVAPAAPRPAVQSLHRDEEEEEPELPPKRRRVLSERELKARYPGYAKAQPTSLRQQLHWLLVLALVPLAISLLRHTDEETDVKTRLRRTIEHAPEEVQDKIDHMLASEHTDEDKLFALLPNGRLEGAHLPRSSRLHWAYAGLAACLFLGFLMLISTQEEANSYHLLFIGVFTATIGILVLFVIQLIALVTEPLGPPRGGGIGMLILAIIKFIGFSYRSALDPNSNFFLSFLGFTCGVGLCEELVKALPLLVHFRTRATLGWRGALLWGLACGAGFGISEGVSYSGGLYNGIAPASTYVVRFLSCVALHAVWSGSAGITICMRQEYIQKEMPWYEFSVPAIRYVGVVMILHGLYDTFLKKDMHAWALLIALASFGWLAFQCWSAAQEPRTRKASVRSAPA
jgi:RsiW-degrading membrane proteinase PrsW (M82 family)